MNVSDDRATAADYARQGGFTFRIGLDADGEKTRGVGQSYGVQACPTNYVLTPDGRIAYRAVGYDEAAIRDVLAKAGVK